MVLIRSHLGRCSTILEKKFGGRYYIGRCLWGRKIKVRKIKKLKLKIGSRALGENDKLRTRQACALNV